MILYHKQSSALHAFHGHTLLVILLDTMSFQHQEPRGVKATASKRSVHIANPAGELSLCGSRIGHGFRLSSTSTSPAREHSLRQPYALWSDRAEKEINDALLKKCRLLLTKSNCCKLN